jgi:hypothetical protein
LDEGIIASAIFHAISRRIPKLTAFFKKMDDSMETHAFASPTGQTRASNSLRHF